ncbi:MAG: hypothetical protein KAT54_04440 [Candidatus Marinimicrobia bacterium]|nr:hypothetical protein [Candidatus Neomarinimicrobiota bacterium]
MKNPNVFKCLTLLTIVFLVCALVPKVNAQVPDVIDAKTMAKRYLKYGKIDVTEIKMEKLKVEEGSDYGSIKFTGTAIYKPARIGKKPLKDIQTQLYIDFYDKNGLKVWKNGFFPACGENKQVENVKYKKPFPFEIEWHYIKLERFNKIESCKVKVWWIQQR